MDVIQVTGRITEAGRLEADLPPGLPPGEVQVTIQMNADETWTDEEIAEMLKSVPSLTGREIVEAGLLGGWKDQDIPDGATWVEEQRSKHREQTGW